jgi:hypothetical protein
MFVSNGKTTVERDYRKVRFSRNGGVIDLHIDGRWVAGFSPFVLEHVLAELSPNSTKHGEHVDVLAEYDRPVRG